MIMMQLAKLCKHDENELHIFGDQGRVDRDVKLMSPDEGFAARQVRQ